MEEMTETVHTAAIGAAALAFEDWHDASEEPMWVFDPEGWADLGPADQAEYRREWERLNDGLA
jgi:hypothetical protein